jgi:hypothetical protein
MSRICIVGLVYLLIGRFASAATWCEKSQPISTLVHQETAGKPARNLGLAANRNFVNTLILSRHGSGGSVDTTFTGFNYQMGGPPGPQTIPSAEVISSPSIYPTLAPSTFDQASIKIISDGNSLVTVYKAIPSLSLSFRRFNAIQSTTVSAPESTILVSTSWYASANFKTAAINYGTNALTSSYQRTMALAYLSPTKTLSVKVLIPSGSGGWESITIPNAPIISGGFDIASDGSGFLICGVVSSKTIKCFAANPYDASPSFTSTMDFPYTTTLASSDIYLSSCGMTGHYALATTVQLVSTSEYYSSFYSFGGWRTPIKIYGPTAGAVADFVLSGFYTYFLMGYGTTCKYSVFYRTSQNIESNSVPNDEDAVWTIVDVVTVFAGPSYSNLRVATNFENILITAQDSISNNVYMKSCYNTPTKAPTYRPTTLRPTTKAPVSG